MTDEELSELAEALDHACGEFIRGGGSITSHVHAPLCRCPLGALLRDGPGLPTPDFVARSSVIPVEIAIGFVYGFSGSDNTRGDRRAFALGLQFRERYRPWGNPEDQAAVDRWVEKALGA